MKRRGVTVKSVPNKILQQIDAHIFPPVPAVSMFTIGPTSGIDLTPARTPVGPVPSHRRYHVRKVAVGLLGLSLTATGLAFGPSASAAPQPKLPAAAPSVAEPAGAEGRTAQPARGQAPRTAGAGSQRRVESGAASRFSATAARSSRSARSARRPPTPTPATAGAQATQDQYVELQPRADRQDLRDPGRVRQRAAPELPGQGHRPGHAGPDHVRRAAAQRDPAAQPGGGQLHRLAAGLQRRTTSGSSTSAPAPATSR